MDCSSPDDDEDMENLEDERDPTKSLEAEFDMAATDDKEDNA